MRKQLRLIIKNLIASRLLHYLSLRTSIEY